MCVCNTAHNILYTSLPYVMQIYIMMLLFINREQIHLFIKHFWVSGYVDYYISWT